MLLNVLKIVQISYPNIWTIFIGQSPSKTTLKQMTYPFAYLFLDCHLKSSV